MEQPEYVKIIKMGCNGLNVKTSINPNIDPGEFEFEIKTDYPEILPNGDYLLRINLEFIIYYAERKIEFSFITHFQLYRAVIPKFEFNDGATQSQITHLVKTVMDQARGFLYTIAGTPEYSYLKGYILPYVGQHRLKPKVITVLTIGGQN